MTKDQTTGVLERAAYAAIMLLLGKLVAKGYLDADLAAYTASGIVAAVGTVWAWWINRPKALVVAASNVPGTTVITSPEISDATPYNNNILSNTESKVVTQ